MFYEVSLIGIMNAVEKYINTWAYREVGAPGEANDPDKCETIALAHLGLWEDVIQAAVGDGVLFTQINVVGYESNGLKSPFPTVEIPITPFNGGVGGSHDGNFLAATVSKRLGAGELMNVGGRIPTRGYWSVGPLVNDVVDGLGALVAASPQYVGLFAWSGLANNPLVLVGGEQVPPVVLSHTQTSVLDPDGVEISPHVTGWAPVINGVLRPRATRRMSRNNLR